MSDILYGRMGPLLGTAALLVAFRLMDGSYANPYIQCAWIGYMMGVGL
jgi:hypothetical protein